MRILTAVMILATATPALAAAPASCPITRAIYTQPGNPGVALGFTKQSVKSRFASDLVLLLNAGQQSFWFGFDMPNGYGGPYITPQIDPKLVKDVPEDSEGSPDDRISPDGAPLDPSEEARASYYTDNQMDFDAFDARLINLARVPQANDAPPRYLFARGLGPLFHYAHNGGLYRLTAQVNVTRDLWRLSGCAAKPH